VPVERVAAVQTLEEKQKCFFLTGSKEGVVKVFLIIESDDKGVHYNDEFHIMKFQNAERHNVKG
jgi:hypothetical protein